MPAQWAQPHGNAPPIVAEYFLRSDTPTGVAQGEIPPEATEAFRALIRSGGLVPLNDEARALATRGGFMEGDQTPLGTLMGGLPGGLGVDYWRVVIDKANTEAQNRVSEAVRRGYFGSTPPRIDPNTGFFDLNDPNLTLEARTAAQNIANQGAQTEITRRLADNTIRETDLADARARASLAEQARQFNVSTGENARQFDVTTGEDRRQFDVTTGVGVASQLAELEANPRTRIQASFLGDTRGGLGPDAGNPTAGSMSFRQALGSVLSPGQVLQGPEQAKPGSAAHYATMNGPDGSVVHYFGTPQVTPDGQVANVPVGAFSRALMQGQGVPTAGRIGTTGGYATAAQVRNDFDLNNVKLADYLRGSRAEQQELMGLSSFDGNSDETTVDTLNKFRPDNKAVYGGSRWSA